MRNLLFIPIFLSVFLASCENEYLDHIHREHTPIISSSGNSDALSGEIFVLPDTRVLEGLVTDIDNAKSRVWLETYTWTEKSTQEAILRAKERGVDVRVILEGNVYRTPWINNDIIKQLQEKDVSFSYADNHKYTFTHIKTWIMDDRWCVSTGNWSYTSFTKNREFIYCGRDEDILSSLIEIFSSDFHHIRPYFPHGLDPHIALAPENMRPWIYESLGRAKTRIVIYNQTISDRELLAYLGDIAIKKGITIQLCQAEKDNETMSFSGEDLATSGIGFFVSKKPYLHAKVILIDDEEVILGSANMTQNAIDNNRDILLSIGKNKIIFNKIFSLYQKDCHLSS